MSGVAIVSYLSVGGSVKLDERYIGSAWRAKWLNRGVDRLDGRWITGCKVCVEGTRIGGESCYLNAQDWIASHHTSEATSIAVSYRKNASSVDAIGLREVRNQVFDESDIIDVRICPARCP